ncbi:MAG: redox-sensing transcriptional repressor Rex [Dermatophilaceae bacterium]
MSMQPPERRDIPAATVTRLPQYLRSLHALAAGGVTSVSSEELAAASGVRSTQLRKDLSHLGSHGVRGVGYDVAHLTAELAGALGVTRTWPVAIVGMGNLGRALAAYSGFAPEGFDIVAVLDHDPALVGDSVGQLTVRPMTDLPILVAQEGIAIGVLATSVSGAQSAADSLIAAGVEAILSFVPVVLTVPAHVSVRRVDLATELHVLAFLRQPDSLAATSPVATDVGRAV